MSSIYFPVDMNLSPRWVAKLNAAGFDAEHWSSSGPGDASDTEIVDFARTNDMVVLTHDLDFGTILALTNWEKPSVVQIRADDTSPENIGDLVIRAIVQTSGPLGEGAVLTVEPSRSRLRLLPFRT